MELHFLDENYKIAHICDDFISLYYTEAFCDCGEFSCTLSLTGEYIPKIGDPILCGGRLLYIVEKETRDTEKGTLTLHGSGILSYFSRQIVDKSVRINAPCETILTMLLNAFGKAALPGEVTDTSPASAEIVQYAVREGNLLSVMKEICAIWGRGLSLTYDFDNENFIFSAPMIKDRRLGNTENNSPVFLSEGFDTLLGGMFTEDMSDYVNQVTVRGAEKEDGSYYTVNVHSGDYDFGDGFNDNGEALHTAYLPVSVSTALYTTDNGDGTKTFDEASYTEALCTRGRAKLALCRPRREIEATVSASAAKDLSPGDLCTVFSPASEIQEVRLVEMRYEISRGKKSYTAVFRV